MRIAIISIMLLMTKVCEGQSEIRYVFPENRAVSIEAKNSESAFSISEYNYTIAYPCDDVMVLYIESGECHGAPGLPGGMQITITVLVKDGYNEKLAFETWKYNSMVTTQHRGWTMEKK